MQGLKLIQKTKRTSSPRSPAPLTLTGRKSTKTFDEGLNDDDDNGDSDEVVMFEYKIRLAVWTYVMLATLQ